MAGIGKQLAEGRPPKYGSREEVLEKIQAYKEYLKENNKPATIAGGAYWLGMPRQVFYQYGDRDDYSDTIKEFREWILYELEQSAAEKGHAGNIFLMKNYGYTDRQDLSVMGDLKLEFGWSGADSGEKEPENDPED